MEELNEKLVRAYIGDKADKMYDSTKDGGGFNIWSILFGAIYFAYRKMYLIAIAILVIVNLIPYLFPDFAQMFYYIIYFAIGILFYPLYRWDITRKLKKVKKDNQNADEDQLLSIAKNKGGTSILGVIIFCLIYFLIAFFTIFL